MTTIHPLRQIRKLLTPPRRAALRNAVVALGIFLLIFWQFDNWIDGHLYQMSRRHIRARLATKDISLTRALERRLSLVKELTAFTAAQVAYHKSVPQHEFETFARVLYENTPGIRNIALAPYGVIAYVYPYEENKAILGYEPAADERAYVREEVKRALESGSVVVSLPYELIQGGHGVIARQAVFIDGQYWGLANIVVDLPALLAEAGLSPYPPGITIAIKDQTGQVFWGEAAVFAQQPVTYTIELPEGSWELAGAPAMGWPKTYRYQLLFVRLLSILTIFSLVTVVYLVTNRQKRLKWTVEQRTRHLTQTLHALQEQENLLLSMAEHFPHAYVAIVEADLTASFVSGQEFASQGLDLDDFVGVPITEFFGDQADTVKDYFLKTLAGEEQSFELRVETGDYLLFKTTPLPAVQGEITRILVVVENITEREQAERALRESEENYRILFEESSDGILVLDEQEQVLEANKRICTMLGYSKEELLGSNVTILIHPEDVNDKDDVAEQALLRGETLLSERRVRRKDGIYIYTELSTKMLGPGRFLCIVHDVTERLQAQEALRKINVQLEKRVQERTTELRKRIAEAEHLNRGMLNLLDDLRAANRKAEENARRLEATNKELESFSYSVSHDLRAPLRAIAGYARILDEDYRDRLDAEGQRILDVIQSEAQRMRTLIDGLLRFSRLGRQALDMYTVDMQTLVQQVYTELMRNWPDREVDFRLGTLTSAEADPALVRQVWMNLLDNALKFSRGRKDCYIEVGSREEENEIVYWVKDNGVGFDAHYSGKLFTVFQRLHTQEEFEGMGVGLALVQRIVNRHGGRVWAEGQVDAGATFYFTLPRQDANRSPVT